MKKMIALGALALAAAGAQAATVTYAFTNPMQNTEVNQSGALGLFDTTLGTLTGATLTFGADLAGTIDLILGASTGPAQVRGTVSSDMGVNSSLASVDSLFNGIADVTLSYTTGFVPLTPNSSYQSPTKTASESLVVDLASVLGTLGAAGGGSFNLGCESLSGLTITGGAGFAGGSQTTQGACNASIVYVYDEATTPVEVPEPTTLSLMGLAALGLAARSRRKAK